MIKKNFILIAATIVFASCGKNNYTILPQQQIIAKWAIVSNISAQYGRYPYRDTIYGAMLDYATFTTDRKVFWYLTPNRGIRNGHDTSTYLILNKSFIKLDRDTFQIRTLSNDSLIIFNRKYFDGSFGIDSADMLLSFKK